MSIIKSVFISFLVLSSLFLTANTITNTSLVKKQKHQDLSLSCACVSFVSFTVIGALYGISQSNKMNSDRFFFDTRLGMESDPIHPMCAFLVRAVYNTVVYGAMGGIGGFMGGIIFYETVLREDTSNVESK